MERFVYLYIVCEPPYNHLPRPTNHPLQILGSGLMTSIEEPLRNGHAPLYSYFVQHTTFRWIR